MNFPSTLLKLALAVAIAAPSLHAQTTITVSPENTAQWCGPLQDGAFPKTSIVDVYCPDGSGVPIADEHGNQGLMFYDPIYNSRLNTIGFFSGFDGLGFYAVTAFSQSVLPTGYTRSYPGVPDGLPIYTQSFVFAGGGGWVRIAIQPGRKPQWYILNGTITIL